MDLTARKNIYMTQMQRGCGFVSFPYKATAVNGCIYTRYWYDFSELEIDLKTGEWHSFRYDIQGNDDRMNFPITKRTQIWTENWWLTTEWLIDSVTDGSVSRDDADAAYYGAINANSDGTCGMKIHTFIMSKTEN
jgi:hypothetical protein